MLSHVNWRHITENLVYKVLLFSGWQLVRRSWLTHYVSEQLNRNQEAVYFAGKGLKMDMLGPVNVWYARPMAEVMTQVWWSSSPLTFPTMPVGRWAWVSASVHSEREGRACPPSARRPSSARGLDLLFPTAGAEHMCTASYSLPGLWLPWGMTSLVQKSNWIWTLH